MKLTPVEDELREVMKILTQIEDNYSMKHHTTDLQRGIRQGISLARGIVLERINKVKALDFFV